MLCHIIAAGIDRPKAVGDLAAHQHTVVGVPGPQGDIRLAFGQIDVFVAQDKFNLQARIGKVKTVKQTRGVQPERNRFRAGYPDNASHHPALMAHGLLEGIDGYGHGPGLRQDSCPQISQLIARRQAFHQTMAQPGLKLGQSALHGGLVHPKGPGRSKHAARIGHGKQKAQVVPVEHCVPRNSAAPFRNDAAARRET